MRRDARQADTLGLYPGGGFLKAAFSWEHSGDVLAGGDGGAAATAGGGG